MAMLIRAAGTRILQKQSTYKTSKIKRLINLTKTLSIRFSKCRYVMQTKYCNSFASSQTNKVIERNIDENFTSEPISKQNCKQLLEK